MKQISVIWISIMLAFSSAFILIDISDDSEGKIIVNNRVEYVPHAPIRIDSNSEFDATHGVVNWATGDGSQGNPWIIENWDINGGGIGTCIFVGNTTDYFEIRDCYLHDANGTYGWPLFRNAGINLYYASNGTIDYNSLQSNNYAGLILFYSDNTNVTNNTINNGNWGIYSEASNNNTYVGNTVYQNNKGISLSWTGMLEGSNFNKIFKNNFTQNGGAVRLNRASNNKIIYNSICGNGGGVDIYMGEYNIVQDNNISYNDEDYYAYGLFLSHTEHNFVSNNTLLYNWGSAIDVGSAPNNTFIDNIMVEGGLTLRGGQIQDFNTQSISESNTIDGKPICYLKNQTGGSVSPDVGQVLLGNCTNMVIENFNFQNLYAGIILGFSEDITISNITSINNVEGIFIQHSNDNVIKDCTLSYNELHGLWLFFSSGNEVYNNMISYNGPDAIWINAGFNNMIHNNNVSFNIGYALALSGILKYDNLFYHNNFIENGQHCSDNGTNYWNVAPPIGGNYWSDYTGIDAGGDGFGDTPYVILGTGGNFDYWPLMNSGKPMVNLTTPIGGEVWTVGTNRDINWTMSDNWDSASDLRVSLDYSVDGGVTYPYKIFSNQTGFSSTSSYNWEVQNTPGSNVIIRVAVEDTTRSIVYDTNTAPLTIVPVLPIISVGSPNDGESLMGNGSWDISWTASGGSNPLLANPINIEYSTTGSGGPWIPITSSESNDGLYTWNPIPILDESNCYIRIIAEDDMGFTGEDISDTSFKIDSTAPLPARNPIAELAGNHVTIYWDASLSSDVDYYEIWRVQSIFNSSGGGYNFLGSTNNTNYTDLNTGVINPNAYFWQVRTVDRAGHVTETILQAGKESSTLSVFANPSGWFLQGYYLNLADTSVEYVLQSLGVNVDHVMLSRNGQWLHWASYWPSSLNTLTDIFQGEGFWVHTTTNERWCVAGQVSDVAIPLTAGWNLVAYPSPVEDTVANALWGTGADKVEVFDPGEPYRIREVGPTYVMRPGEGYWIHVPVDSIWAVNW